jgi:acyl-coenzyme A synthetase/AMP-(fatty) acid ligase
VVITDSLPRTASGKVQKHVLKKRAIDELSGL